MNQTRFLRRAAGLLILAVIQFSLAGCIPIGIKGQSRLAMVSVDAHPTPSSPPTPVAAADR